MRRQDARLTRLIRGKGESPKVIHVDWWQGSSSQPAHPESRSFRAGWGLAAMVLLMLSMVLFLVPNSDEAPGETVAVAAKETNTQRLPDGSLVSLDTLGSMRVDFTEKQRGVHLFHGQSLLDVAADRGRPFVVHTFLVDITSVVESNFAVRIDTSVEVEVFEGVVEVSARGAKAGSPVVRVEKGETYRVPVDRFRAFVAEDYQTAAARRDQNQEPGPACRGYGHPPCSSGVQRHARRG